MQLPRYIPCDKIECVLLEDEDQEIESYALMYEGGILCVCMSQVVAITILSALHKAGSLEREELH